MEGFEKQVATRLPLGEAVLRLFDFVCQEEFLDGAFERHRGRSYEEKIKFPLFVQLIADALLKHDGSGRKSFQRAEINGNLATTIRAPYGKLARVPLSLSIGFFSEATSALNPVYPPSVASREVPTRLQEMEVIYHDGKKIKLRWGIEQVFQKVTQVFHLRTLIESIPQATVFQAPFCLLRYNMIQVIRAYVAEGQESKVKEISIENLFYDVQRQLIAWHEVLSVEATVGLLSTTWTAAQVANRLRQLLHGQWSACWRKTPSNTHRAPPKNTDYLKGGHYSVYRPIQQARDGT